MEHNLFHIVAASGDAVAGKGVIGKDNQVPWRYSDDMRFFKATTMGHTVVMGRKTFESMGRKGLTGRENIVVSHSVFPVPEEVKLVHSVDEAIQSASHPNVFIIGGGELYRQTIQMAEGIYLTSIPGDYEGDVKYPPIPNLFKENEERSRALREKFGIPIIYFENTGGTTAL